MNNTYIKQNDSREKSPEELQHEIEKTRQRMDHTVDQLADRLDPRENLTNLADWAREQLNSVDAEKVKETGQKAVDYAKQNPLPFLLGAAAVASILIPRKSSPKPQAEKKDQEPRNYSPHEYHFNSRSVTPAGSNSGNGNQSGIESTLESLKEKTSATIDTAKEKASDAIDTTKEVVSDTLDSAGETLSESCAHTTESLAAAKRNVKSQACSFAEKTRLKFERGRDNTPLSLALGAAAVGFLAALGCPRTRKEDQILGEKSDQLFDKMKSKKAEVNEAVRDKIEDLKESGHEVIDEVVEKAEQKIEQHACCHESATSATAF